ncbi:MAG: hypothetical protein HY696_10820 [Deltaproteobacteria bacterium]|nr:hypothetical protein [Deltaproteobacteria bacterium]
MSTSIEQRLAKPRAGVGGATRKPKPKPIRIPTKISENLSWMLRHLRRAKRQMPSLTLPKQVRSYKPPLNREMRVYGTCSVEAKVITIATHRPVLIQMGKRRRRKHIAIPQRELLMTFAHELAHLRYGLHNYEQESYARTIFHAFGLKDNCPHCGGTGKVVARYVN